MLKPINMKWVAICYGGTKWDFLRKQIETARQMHEAFPDHIAWATSFNLSNWESPEWLADSKALINESFENGAVAVKVWKEIGMVLRDGGNRFVMIDDSSFNPIFELIQQRNKTLVAHIGEPKSGWQPLDKIQVKVDRDYYNAHPEEHLCENKEVPNYWEHIQAMTKVLENHRHLRVVWCHLASLECELERLSKMFDKYPNFAVDLAARITHLQVQDRELIRDFFIKYQDRILYGTDTELESTDTVGYQDEFRLARDNYVRDLIYFSTDWELDAQGENDSYYGLDLPPDVLEKIFYKNALIWYSSI
ncbi:amidohydrolase family protein [Gemmatimonadota bacterium]